MLKVESHISYELSRQNELDLAVDPSDASGRIRFHQMSRADLLSSPGFAALEEGFRPVHECVQETLTSSLADRIQSAPDIVENESYGSPIHSLFLVHGRVLVQGARRVSPKGAASRRREV